MSAFDNREWDNLEREIRLFLADHSIGNLMEIVKYCIEDKEDSFPTFCPDCGYDLKGGVENGSLD